MYSLQKQHNFVIGSPGVMGLNFKVITTDLAIIVNREHGGTKNFICVNYILCSLIQELTVFSNQQTPRKDFTQQCIRG